MLHGPTAVTVAVRIFPLQTAYPPLAGVASLIKAKVNESPIWAAGRLNTRDKTRNLLLKEIVDADSPVSIQFDVGDKQTLNPLGNHAAHWGNYIGEVVRKVSLYYPSWEKVPKQWKVAIISDIGTMFNLRPYIESSRSTEIYEGINNHLQKA